MSRIDIEPEEDSNDLPPRLAADEGQEPSHLRGQDGRDENSRMGRNKRELPWKVHITVYLWFDSNIIITCQRRC